MFLIRGRLSTFCTLLLAGLGLMALGCQKESEPPSENESIRRPRKRPGPYEVWGLDLSHHQDRVDWDLLGEDPPHFIYLKATEGRTHLDRKYSDYRKRARALGVPSGAYHFFTYRSSGADQAKFFAENAPPRPGDLPPVLDVEFARRMPDRATVRREIDSFIRTYVELTGRRPILYAGCVYLRDYVSRETADESWLWAPDYRREPPCAWIFWQSSERHRQLGIEGYVDLNFFRGSRSDLADFCLR
jgi:lysozyme